MNEIIVKSQKELDELPIDYNGRIMIEFGTPYDRAVVNRRFKFSVVAWGNSSVVAWGNSSVEAMGNSSVEAMGNSSVVARDNSSVVAWGNSSVVARGNSSVEAWDNSSVVAWDNSSVVAWDNSSVVAWDNSSVVAWGNSSVVAWDNSSVVANANVQVTDASHKHDIKVSGNARIVYNPRNIDEYIEFYGLEHADGKVKLFKAVRKDDKGYFSSHSPNFRYVIGETAKADRLDKDVHEDCGHGIHMASKAWCIAFGRSWKDIAILEVEAEISKIIVPVGGCGKVRAAEAKVLREIPLEECGLYGQILAKRRRSDG